MSILRPVVRQCAVAALRNHTWAGSLVFDSDMTPFGQAVAGKAAKPYVCVYTDSDDRMPLDAEMYEGERRALTLVIEMGIASAVLADDGVVRINFSATDAGQEMAVDILESQIIAALWGDPNSVWGNLLRRILYQVKRMPSRRGGQAQNSIRFAARRTTFVCTCIDDVPPGVTLSDNHPVMDFISMAAGSDPSLGIIAAGDIIGKALQQMAIGTLPDWQQAQAYMGMNTEAAKDLNADGTPLPWPNVEQPPLDWSDSTANPAVTEDIESPMNIEGEP